MTDDKTLREIEELANKIDPEQTSGYISPIIGETYLKEAEKVIFNSAPEGDPEELSPEQSAQKERLSLLNGVIGLNLINIDLCNPGDPFELREALADSLTQILTDPVISKLVSAVNREESALSHKYAEKTAMINELLKAPALIEPIEGTPFYKFTAYASHNEVRSRIGSFEQLYSADFMRYESKGNIYPYANSRSLYTGLNNKTFTKRYEAAHKEDQR